MNVFAKKIVPAVLMVAAASAFAGESVYLQSSGDGDVASVPRALKGAGYNLLPAGGAMLDAPLVGFFGTTSVGDDGRVTIAMALAFTGYNCVVGDRQFVLAFGNGGTVRTNTNPTPKRVLELRTEASVDRAKYILDDLRSDDIKEVKGQCAFLKAHFKG
jgi:hypothetical protein